MSKGSEAAFHELFTGVAELYGQNPSPAVFEIWFNALKRFEIRDIGRAFSVHVQSPDQGRFMPKPADIIRILEGSAKETAFAAWTKVYQAIGRVGSYASVVFDDPIIHRVIRDMGGWVYLCGIAEDEVPFKANDFVARYQGFRSSGEVPDYPRMLVGIVEGENRLNGYLDEIPEPVRIGDPEKARQVYLAGTDKPCLQITEGRGKGFGRLDVKRIGLAN